MQSQLIKWSGRKFVYASWEVDVEFHGQGGRSHEGFHFANGTFLQDSTSKSRIPTERVPCRFLQVVRRFSGHNPIKFIQTKPFQLHQLNCLFWGYAFEWVVKLVGQPDPRHVSFHWTFSHVHGMFLKECDFPFLFLHSVRAIKCQFPPQLVTSETQIWLVLCVIKRA